MEHRRTRTLSGFARLGSIRPAALMLIMGGLLCIGSQPARCQDSPTSQEPHARLEAVRVSGSKRFPSEKIVAALSLKVGDSVSRADLQKGADTLSQLGIFSNVQYRFSSPLSGVQVEFVVIDALELPIVFDNFPWVTDDDLTAAIHAAVPLFDGSAPAGGALLDGMDTAIEVFLEKKGVFAKVSHAKMSSPLTDEPVMTFLAAGPLQNVKSLEFVEPIASDNRGIHDRLSDLVGKPYSRTALELFEVEQVRPIYYSRGLLKVHFNTPVIQAEAGSGDSSGTAPTAVAVRVTIEAGAAYSWGGLTWNGNSAISSADLNGLVNLKPGDLADGTKTTGLWNRIADDYGHRGYLDAKIDTAPQFDEQAHRVTYTVNITEGPQYHMGKLVLSGLSVAGEQRVREAWSIKPGAVFDEGFFDEFIESGAKDSFVGIPYTYQKIGHYLEKNAVGETVDVMLDFE